MITVIEKLTASFSGDRPRPSSEGPQTLKIPDKQGHYYALGTAEVITTEAQPSVIQGESLYYNVIFWYTTYEFWEDGNEFIDHGYWIRWIPNGDKIFHIFNGQTGEVKLTGGTGKFGNIKGNGLYKGEIKSEGLWQARYEWGYEID